MRIDRKMFNNLTAIELAGWQALHDESAYSRWAFLSPAFSAAVNACMAPVSVILCWQDNQLVGVMPLQRKTGWLGRLGLYVGAGDTYADYFGIVAKPAMKISWKELLEGSKIFCMYFSHLDEMQANHGLTGNQARVGYRTRIHSDGGAAHWEWLRTKDKELVRDTERRERNLVRDHGVIAFEMQSTIPNDDLRRLVLLKNAQYVRTGRADGTLFDEPKIAMLQHLLEANAAGSRVLLSSLRCDGKLCALHFGLQAGETLHRWFPVYVPEFSHYSPGRILYRYILLEAEQFGIRCIDRGDGDTAAKRDFATESHRFFKGLQARGVRGQLLATAQRLAWRFAG